MLTAEQIETVLISTEPTPTGHERIVAAFRSGDDLFVPLDKGRPANVDLLNHDRLYVRRTDNAHEYSVYEVNEHRTISTSDRQRLEAWVHRPISVTTEVLHLVGTESSVGREDPSTPGFVAVIDGSERALRALAPALAISDWYGRPIEVYAVTSGPDDVDITSAIELQLAGTRLTADDVTYVAKKDLEVCLFDLMRQGQIVVASAFGVWAVDGRLHGLLNGLVKHNAPAVIGIGPNVPHDWAPTTEDPVVICVDATEHAKDFVGRIDPLISPPRSPLMVVHVTTETPPDQSIALDVARQLNHRYGMPVVAKHIKGTHAAETIGAVATTVSAQMLVLNSWHRPTSDAPPLASTSVTTVAHAECPVVILSAP